MADEYQPLYPHQIIALKRILGIGAIIVDLDHIDYTRGRVETSPNCFKMWTLDKKRINIDTIMHGQDSPAMFATQTKEVAEDWPIEPAFPDTSQHNIQKCINPFCDNQVNLSERKSGACCKACMNYECIHPTCIIRAKVNGWKRATHPWGTKIAELHKEYRRFAGEGAMDYIEQYRQDRAATVERIMAQLEASQPQRDTLLENSLQAIDEDDLFDPTEPDADDSPYPEFTLEIDDLEWQDNIPYSGQPTPHETDDNISPAELGLLPVA